MENENIKQGIMIPLKNLMAIVFPAIDIFSILHNSSVNLSNILLINKLIRFLEKQDKDFEEKLKLSSEFTIDSKQYNKNVRLLINTINSINDDNKIDIYANLTRAWLRELLVKDIYLRLSFIVSNIYFEDLVYLKKHISMGIETSYDDVVQIEVQSLLQHNLIYCKNEGTWIAARGDRSYACTPLGVELVRCGVDFENYAIYKVKEVSRDIPDMNKPESITTNEIEQMFNEKLRIGTIDGMEFNET